MESGEIDTSQPPLNDEEQSKNKRIKALPSKEILFFLASLLRLAQFSIISLLWWKKMAGLSLD